MPFWKVLMLMIEDTGDRGHFDSISELVRESGAAGVVWRSQTSPNREIEMLCLVGRNFLCSRG